MGACEAPHQPVHLYWLIEKIAFSFQRKVGLFKNV